MQAVDRTPDELLARITDLEARLAEAQQTLEAIRKGDVDAIVVGQGGAEQVYTLRGADEPYRMIVEHMKEGAVSVTSGGTILYANAQVSTLLGVPLKRIVGSRIREFTAEAHEPEINALLGVAPGETCKTETFLRGPDGAMVPVYIAAAPMKIDGANCIGMVIVDQTEQKRNEEIAASEKLARAILDQVYEAVVVLDPGGRIARANQAAHALAGRNVLFAGFDEVFRAVDAAAAPLSGLFRSAAAGREAVISVEARLRRVDESLATVLLSAGPLVSDGGAAVGCVVSLTDITERKRAEEALTVANHRFTLAAKAVNGVIYDWDLAAGQMVRTSGLQDLLGYSPEEVGTEAQWWLDRIHPKDLAKMTGQFDEALRFRDALVSEYRIRHRDGHYIHVLDRSLIMRDGFGHPVRVVGTTVDLTDRKRLEDALRASEARVRRLIDANIIGVATATMDGVIDANDHFLRIIGATPQDLAAGKVDWIKATPPEQLERDVRALDELRERGVAAPFEKEYIRPDETRVPILIGSAALQFDPLEWICFVVDLTELKQAQQELEHANTALQKSNEELQQFAFVASHDLQEPLRTIGGMSELIYRTHKGLLGADTDEMLDHIRDAVQRMSRLISDLLDYARVTNETAAPTRAVNAGHLANFAVANLQQRIQETQAKVTVDELPTVLGDEQLVRVFQNMVGNALKYRSEAPPEIHISSRREGPDWVFEVRDNGIGFEMRYAERVFEVFKRLHGRTEYTGSGIGLAICKRIIERHGGRVWARSKPGEGSVFSFSIPAVEGLIPPTSTPPTG